MVSEFNYFLEKKKCSISTQQSLGKKKMGAKPVNPFGKKKLEPKLNELLGRIKNISIVISLER